MLERAHVVEPVGELDENDAHVVNHREQHLANVLGLLLLARLVAYLRDFGKPVNEVRDLFAERRAYDFRLDERVLYNIVEKAGGYGDFVESHVGEDVRDFERVDEVRLAGGARLALVMEGGEKVSAPQNVKVGLRVVAPNFFDYLLDANHKNSSQ
jgi:hypothetical protein